MLVRSLNFSRFVRCLKILCDLLDCDMLELTKFFKLQEGCTLSIRKKWLQGCKSKPRCIWEPELNSEFDPRDALII